jgi:GT2 family glycosyltransferase
MKSLALITVLYKSDEVLDDFFASIAIQSNNDYTLYLIDNSFNPTTEQLIIDLSAKYTLTNFIHINTGGNIGVAAGNNIGIKKAINDGFKDLILLNNDIVFHQNFLFAEILHLSEQYKLITPSILYYDTNIIWMAGGHMDYCKGLGVHNGMGKAADQAPPSGLVTYAPTCFLYIHADVFELIGLMDEKYFAYYDDTDFVLRSIRNSYLIWYENSLTVFHKVSTSSGGENSPFYAYYGSRNKLYFIRKNFKGIHKYFLLFYTFITRIGFYIKYNALCKKKLLQGLRDGMWIKLSN